MSNKIHPTEGFSIESVESNEYYEKDKKRIDKTIDKVCQLCPPPNTIFDLGSENWISSKLEDIGYSVQNSGYVDLDLVSVNSNANILTAFEVIEHLVNPFKVLSESRQKYLLASVPIIFPLNKSYRNENLPWGRHFHEFEPWQFDWLLDKSGWKIIECEKWNFHKFNIGIRPLIRQFYPSHYFTFAKRKELD